jgi:hypothetical protein
MRDDLLSTYDLLCMKVASTSTRQCNTRLRETIRLRNGHRQLHDLVLVGPFLCNSRNCPPCAYAQTASLNFIVRMTYPLTHTISLSSGDTLQAKNAKFDDNSSNTCTASKSLGARVAWKLMNNVVVYTSLGVVSRGRSSGRSTCWTYGVIWSV